MADNSGDPLQQIAELLREYLDERRRAIGKAVQKFKDMPDTDKYLARAQEQQRETREFRQAVLAELRVISGCLTQIAHQTPPPRSGEAG